VKTNARAKMSELRQGFVKLFCRQDSGVVVGGVVENLPVTSTEPAELRAS
jgi:pyruvate/2-oxoglutarate dehydrogenase complex dihydrolipoamide dehydrogenase (E3) component